MGPRVVSTEDDGVCARWATVPDTRSSFIWTAGYTWTLLSLPVDVAARDARDECESTF